MSGGLFCSCEERKKPVTKRRWSIMQYRENHSAFNGYRATPSDWSEIRCESCGGRWRTKANYVFHLRHAERR